MWVNLSDYNDVELGLKEEETFGSDQGMVFGLKHSI